MSNTVFELNDTTLTVKPVGELNSMTSPDFEEELRAHLSGVNNLIVDFENVDYISSAGIRLFLGLNQTLKNRGAEMKLIHVSDPIMSIFDMIGFRDVVTVE